MKLTAFQLQNYKSFQNSGPLTFSNGFNVIVGQNNVGKSALLQGIGLRFPQNPHRSLQSQPKPATPINPQSRAEFTIECTGDELRDALLNCGRQFFIPAPQGAPQQVSQVPIQILDALFKQSTITLHLQRFGNGEVTASRMPSFDDYPRDPQRYFSLTPMPGEGRFQHGGPFVSGNDLSSSELGAAVGRIFAQHTYLFQAERLSLAKTPFGHSPVLKSDASNLPEALNALQSNNPARFQRFSRYVSQILPTIRHVAVRPGLGNGSLEVILWTIDPATEREDLVIGLEDSGTGVGQVLAILYVAVTSPESRVIVIDEPNSFLNPGAAKKLIEICREFNHLQYIIATHSPETMHVAQPETLTVTHWRDGVSTARQIDPTDMESLREILREVGASAFDVFGAERVLWVEGPTEAACFRMIMERSLPTLLAGTAIAALPDVGRLTRLKPPATLIWKIYRELSGAGALMPPAIAFSFDREGRSETEREDLIRMSDGIAHFLPRRMYENYLLDPDAIATVLSKEDRENAEINVKQVREWIESRAQEFNPSERPNEAGAYSNGIGG